VTTSYIALVTPLERGPRQRANMDDLEIHDERRILPNSCFSIEPGVYLPEFGVRSEINMLVRRALPK